MTTRRLASVRFMLSMLGLLALSHLVPAGAQPSGTASLRAASLQERDGAFGDYQRARGTQPLQAPGREIADLRTRTTRTYQGPGDTEITRFFPTAVNFRADGRWRPIDNTLERTPTGFENAANGYRLRLPPNLGAGAVAAREGNHSISFELEGAEGAARVQGSRALYADALPGVDVAYTAGADAVKEELILDNAGAPARYTFELGLTDGLAARARPDGTVGIVDSDGSEPFRIAAPFMRDAAGEISRDVRYELQRGSDGYRLTLIAERDWLRSPSRQWPVTIDPTIDFEGAAKDCYIVSAPYADESFCGYEELAVGRTGSETSRSLLRFDVQDHIHRADDVVDAELGLYAFDDTTGTPMTVDVHPVTQGWTGDATWNQRSAGAPWTSPGGDFAPQAAASNPQVGGQLGWEHWDVTALVRGWVDRSRSNHGMLLKQRGETTANEVFFDSTYSSYSTVPYLDVTYEALTGVLPQYTFDQEQALTDRTSMAVNVANGNLVVGERDLQIPGTGVDLAVERWYSSVTNRATDIGRGWRITGYDNYLTELPDGDVLFHGPSGYVKRFARRADGSYSDPDGINVRLTKLPEGGWKLRWNKADITWEYRPRLENRGQLARQVDDNGNVISFHYEPDEGDDLLKITDTQGRVVHFGHTDGEITSMEDSAGRDYSYDIQYTDNGEMRLGSYVDPSGGLTDYDYDSAGNLVYIGHPSGRDTYFGYDGRHRIKWIDRGGHVTNFAYDQHDTDCGDNQATVVKDARGNKTTYCWDANGRVDEVYDALGRKRSRQYGSNSNVLSFTGAGGGAASPTYSTTATYDGNDNLTGIDQPDGAGSDFAYEGANPFDLTRSTDAQGSERNFNYDSSGNLRRIGTRTQQGAAETLATFEYNGNGTVSASIDGNGNRTAYGYDSKGNLTSIDPPDPLGSISLTVDGLSRVTSLTDGKGQRRTFTYDARDRVTKVQFHNASGQLESTVSSTFDKDGHRLTRTDPKGKTSYSYDARSLLTQEAFPDARAVRYAYDPVGNLASTTDPGGTVLYQYNPVNLLTTLTEPDGKQTTYDYNADNSLTRTSYPNGVVERREYNKAERLTAIKATGPSGQALTDFGYGYSNPGRGGATSQLVQRMTDGVRGTTTTYDYDHLGRLTSRITTGAASESYSYSYDANSNRLHQTIENGQHTNYTHNAANQVTSAGGTSYEYDANGNLTSSSDGWQLTYNARNQTTAITPPGGTQQSIAYLGAGQTEMFDRAGVRYLNNALAAGQSVGRRGNDAYVRSPDGRLHSQRSNAGTHYYLFRGDPDGSVAALTGSGGTVAVRYREDPFGRPTGQDGSVANPFRLAGQEYVDDLRLYKMGERWYDPALGRFTQQDPLNQVYDPRQSNRFLYAGQDPVNVTDPTGLQAWYNEEGQYCETIIAEAPSDKWDYMYTSTCGPPPFTSVPFSSPTPGSFAASCLVGTVNPIGSCKRSVFVHPFIAPLVYPEPAY